MGRIDAFSPARDTNDTKNLPGDTRTKQEIGNLRLRGRVAANETSTRRKPPSVDLITA
jgi:hypothetical protein